MLAGPGTWAQIAPEARGRDGALVAFPTFQARRGQADDLAVRVMSTLGATGEQLAAGLSEQDVRSKVRSRAQSASEAARPWTTQSPLSLWAPGMILIPLCTLIGYAILVRRLGPAIRLMTAQGVRVRVAVTAAWLVPTPMLALLVTVAATAGALGGLWLASFGAGR